jgi:hypothetical protein
MPSKFQHIDDFVRNKEQEIPGSDQHADMHWQQLQQQLNPALHSIPAAKTKRLPAILKYAAAAAILIAGIVSWYFFSKNSDPAPADQPVVKQNTLPSTDPLIRVPVKNEPDTSNYLMPGDPIVTTADGLLSKDQQHNTTTDYQPIINQSSNNVMPGEKLEYVATNKDVFEHFYSDLKKRPNEFSIDIKRDTLLYCQEGTSLFIPANSFETVSGLAISTNVDVLVQEFYSFADIIGNKLTTGSGWRPLITGGMLNITATAQGQAVKMKAGASLDVKMPARTSFHPGMRLFTGEVVNKSSSSPSLSANSNIPVFNDSSFFKGAVVNWLDRGQQQFFLKDDKKMVLLFNLMDNPYSTERNGKNELTGKFMMPYACKWSKEEMKTELEKRYGTKYKTIKVRREWGAISGKYRHNPNELKKDWRATDLVGDSIYIPLAAASRLNLVGKEDSINYEHQFAAQFAEITQRKAAYNEFLQIKNAYNFSISNLGWISCDRFYDLSKSQLTNFVIDPGKDFEHSYTQAIIIFEKENAALPGYWREGGKIYFYQLPIGEEVSIVCMGAKNGKAYSSIQKVKVTPGFVPVLTFRETTPEQFKKELSAFGHVNTN